MQICLVVGKGGVIGWWGDPKREGGGQGVPPSVTLPL